MVESVRDVQLSSALCEAAERKFGARFGGLEPFLNFLLQELLRDAAAEMDQSELRIIEQRLKDLGYM
jgi:hypothetical protein